jgi:hypothetical protein
MYRFGLGHSSIQVSQHHPADFIMTIMDREVFEDIAGRDSFPYGDRQFCLHRWSPRDQATRAAMTYYTRICLEGLPLHLCLERFALAIIGRSCSLYYVEYHSRRRESTEVFELMEWTADPVAILLRVWLMVLDPDHGGQGTPVVTIHRQCPSEPRGLVYDVILHILSIEDTRRHGPDGRPLFYPFCFHLGATD